MDALRRYLKFEEHLFLMTPLKVYHRYRKHGEGSSKFGGMEGALVNVWEYGGRDSLKKGKYLANSYTLACRLKNVKLLLS